MIWRLTYCNKKGVEARIDIIKGNRTPVEIVQGSGDPFAMSYRLDKTDKSGHIMTSSADIEIFETETFNIDDLKTSNETELKVEYFEDNVLSWEGFILPDFFSREIGSPNIVRMTASDRLTALKGVTLSDLPSRISLRSLIELCLAETGLSLGLVSQVQINQGSTNILDSEILSQRLTDVRGRSISCYDILMSIMVGTNSTIRQRAGQWQVYNKLEHELRTPTIFFDKVERGAIRTIQPVASSVGIYQEFGGNKMYPQNYDFSNGLTWWTTVNGFVATINSKEVIGYTGGASNFVPIYGDSIETNSVINKNASFSTSSSPYLKSENIGVSYPDNDSVNVTVEVNATGVGSFITNSFVEFAIIATNTVTSKTLSLSNAGIFETMTNTPHIHRIKFPTVTSFYNASTGSLQVKGVLIAGNENLGDYDIHVRIYGSGESRTSFINSATIKFSVGGDNPKGNLYKTTQGSNFTKQHDIETVIFGDYIRGGINGHFYYYPIDETSNLYLPNGELSSPIWKTFFDTTERPLLHHVSRQKSRLFSVAHDILKANINVDSFDPLAVFQDCKGGKYVVVSASFDFLRAEVDVELEQIAYDNAILKRDFIYSYFGEGEDTIKSIGGIAGGGGTGGGGGGGMTNDQVAILNDVAKLAHLHENKEIIDQITQDMVDNASHEIVISTDTETELTDENILSSLRVLLEIAKNNETFLEDLKERFLSKIEPDTAQKLITFIEGIEVGAFTTGALGAGAAIKMIDGTSYAEVDNLTVRQKATFRELIIESLKHIGGQLVLTPARMKCVRVVDGGTFYKCYFDTGDGEVTNEFVEGDYARCQVFTGSGTKFYWRLVTLVGDDWINLSKTTAAVGSDAPEAGDDITQLGNATDTTRQSAIILSTVGIDAPSWKQYSGINSFSLEGKETTVFSKLGNRISGETVFTSGGANLEDHLDGVAQDILDALQAAQDAEDKAQQAIENAEADVATLNEEIGRLQDQIDGKVSNWYYAYSPTLENYPASDWTTNEIKDAHIGDTFTNTEPAPAENAGKSWRFVKDGSTYSWVVISDSDALKALQEASKAQATADGKSTTYLFQPNKYKLGDMWVLNDDHTINGTVYKQGDLLTATQDSETFNEAHWLKRIRYTDDTAIDNLKIGGSNLLLNTKELKGFPYRASDKYLDFNIARTTVGTSGYLDTFRTTTIAPPEGDTHVVSFYAKSSVPTPIDCHWYNPRTTTSALSSDGLTSTADDGRITLNITTEWKQYWIVWTQTPTDAVKTIIIGRNGRVEGATLEIAGVKLEKGNKPTDWSPAPEDVEANIATAKVDAENAAQAYANTKSEAERVLAEAYADGIVTAEEQARINDVNDKLALAKEYADAQDVVLKTQQEAYADGAISTAEQAAITAAKDYADLKKTEAQAYADGIVSDEEARAIADALEKYNESKAYAETLVDNIEIGGRNYLLGSNKLSTIIDRMDGSTVSVSEEGGGSYNIKSEGGYTANKVVIKHGNNFQIGDKVTISFWINNKTDTVMRTILRGLSLDVKTIPANYAGFFWHSVEKSVDHNTNLLYFQASDSGGNLDFDIRHVKLEKGTKPTDWTPAPEDVEADIETAKTEAESAAKAYADIQAEAERIKAEAYADGKVSDEEARAINDVNDKLAAAKAYAEAQDALLKTQQEAYTDGEISKAEQAAIDAAKDYADLKKTEAEAYADGIVSDEEARAIADALDKFNASKAHAEQLVKDIEIGGRNLYIKSLEVQGVVSGTTGDVGSHYNYHTSDFIKVEPEAYYTFSKYTEAQNHRIAHYDEDKVFIKRVFDSNSSITYQMGADVHYVRYSRDSTSGGFYPKIEKGNKATDWTPAPEDVEANIETAKADAESAAQAYADTKAEAERVIAEAYADGIVTDEEQARIDDVNDKLALAKEYADAQDVVLKTQQEAYADGEISKAEQAAIDAAEAYADLKKQEAEAYADGIVSDEEARAIADALEKYNESKAYAEQLVDDIEIGGRNLLLNSEEIVLEANDSKHNGSNLTIAEDIDPNIFYTLKAKATVTEGEFDRVSIQFREINGATQTLVIYVNIVNGYIQQTLKIPAEAKIFRIYAGVHGSTEGQGIIYRDLKLEKGNKATDWTPAPEDTDRELGYMKARYIRDYLNGSSADARNYWVQIKALNKAGTNIALNKTVTSNIDTVNLARITNGDMDVENFARTLGGNQYVQIDLGQVYYDIDNINVYHYWADGRTFYGTKTQISEDGITWKTIFDSAVSGTYKETVGGKVHTTKLTDLVENVTASIDAEKTRINEILSDNVADPSEKQYLSNLWQEIYAEYPRIWAQANAYSVSKTTYEQKYTALKNILDPVLANLTINSTVSGSSIRTAFSQYYDARTALQNAITNKVNTSAGDALAKANTAAAITDLFSGFNGGLATAVIMEMREPSTTARGDATGFISGMRGDGTLPFLGAGRATSNGVYADAIAGTAKAIIRHDGTVKFTDAEITGVINALSGKIGGLTIKDGKLLIGDVGDHRIELDPSSRKMIFTTHDDFNAGSIGFDAGGAILDLFKRYTGSTAWSSSVRLDGDSFLLKKIGLSDAVTITPTKIKITNGSNTTEILDDGVYVNGVKLTGGGGGSDYVHPSTHSASMITAGTLQGIVKANNNTSYTTKQVRNMILSTNDADSSQMANGDIWIKYE